MLAWLRKRRRKKILARGFPAEWEAIIRRNVLDDCRLAAEQSRQLREITQILVSEKNWEGCQGLEMSDEIRVTIAAQAALMVLGLDDVFFDHVLSVLVYPDTYVAQGVETTRGGVVIERGQARQGEAWWRGPVILSWADALAGSRHETPGRNLIIHEFAHQLDMMNGRTLDGTPPLRNRQELKRWVDVMQPEYTRLVAECRRGHRGFIDCYGATNAAEFFAVLSEAFFTRPQALVRHKPNVYDVLKQFFGLDPAEWPESTWHPSFE